MRVLFLAPRLPYPADTGAKIRTFNLIKNISEENQVTLLSFWFEGTAKAEEEFRKLKIETNLIDTTEKIGLKTILSRLPLSIEKYCCKTMKSKLKELINANQFDVVHFDHLHMGQYLDSVNGIPCILDEHNIESIILDRCADVEKNLAKKVLFKSQAKKMKCFESSLVNKFSKCLTVSENDKSTLLKMSGNKAKVEVIPNGVDTEYFRDSPLRGQSQEEALVFTGSMDWLPNSDAALYFCESILPLVWQKNKNIKFYIVGKNPTAQVKELGKKNARIIVTGSVEDVRPYMARAKVFVCPLRIGGGTRLKILEAMAMEKTVVSTTVGAEGITYTLDKDIIIKDKPQEFADAALSLLKDKTKRDAIGAAGRSLVCSNYDWKIIGKKLTDVYKELINEK